MSLNQTDVEVTSTPEAAPARPFYYDHIPQLSELLRRGGLPGVEYAQVHVQNVVKARDPEFGGWGRIRDAQTYTIGGPRGEVHCELLCRGKPIRGVGPDSGARVCWVDDEVYELTGHPNPDPEKGPKVEPTAEPKAKAEATRAGTTPEPPTPSPPADTGGGARTGPRAKPKPDPEGHMGLPKDAA